MKTLISNEFKGWKKLEVFWLLLACTIITGLSIYWQDSLMGIISATTGVACVVCTGKGKLSAYIFGVVNCVLYAIISYKARLYGETMLNALYYVPMQFIGYWQWRRRGAATDLTVKARSMTLSQRAVLVISCTAAVIAGGFILRHFGDPQPFKDSTTTVLSIVAQALMAMAFMEQWALWIITNVVSVIMWSVCLIRGEAHAAVMLIMWVFYLLNSLNGFRVWCKLSKA